MQAIYTRQSVEKRDSISIETQINECKKWVDGSEECEVFTDKGISGKSVDNRPEFQKMMREVRNGKVTKIVVYKLDRISRSLADFVNMQKEFENYKTKLISTTENFDTSTIMGKAMINILMIFAEMERETIQLRITDNYYARGEQGRYLGGFAPFGYKKIETTLNNQKTYTFEEIPEEKAVMLQMYDDYINGKSLSQIARELNDKAVPTRKGKPWTEVSISRMLKSPLYVKANADVYNYLVSLGATMHNEVSDYTGEKGCMVYGKVEDRTTSKFKSLKTDHVTLGLHKGIVDSSTWLAVQQIFQGKQWHSNLGTGNLSWLQGLVKCKCGYTMYVKRYKQNGKEYRYFYCRGRKNESCKYPRKMLKVAKVESVAEKALFEKLSALKDIPHKEIVTDSPELNALKIELSQVNKKIENIMDSLSEGNEITIQYINQHIAKLDKNRQEILTKIAQFELKTQRTRQVSFNVDEILSNWENYSNYTKKQIAKEVIDEIIIEGTDIQIITL